MKFKILFLLSIITLIFACNRTQEVSNIEAEEPEETSSISADILAKNDRIKMGEIQRKVVLQTINCTGRIELPPTEVISIHSKVSGQVTYLKYLSGDFVKKGALLATIQNIQLIEKQRILLENKAKFDFAKKDFERKKILKTGNATSNKVFDKSQNEYELLTATYNGLKQELTLLGVNTEKLESEGKFQSSVNIYASNSGYIHEVLVNKGQMISPETQLMDIADIDHLHLELQVLSKDIGGIQKGQRVRFTVPNRVDEFEAEVVKINPMIDEQNATLQVHCQIKHSDKKIFVPGLFINAKIELGATEAEGLPLSGIIKEGEEHFAYKLENKNAVKMPLEQVRVSDDFVTFEGNKEGIWVLEGAYYVK